jgi:hypothetical protein
MENKSTLYAMLGESAKTVNIAKCVAFVKLIALTPPSELKSKAELCKFAKEIVDGK